MELLTPVLTAIIADLAVKVIEKLFQPKSQVADGSLTEKQLRWKKFLAFLNRAGSISVVVVALVMLSYTVIQQRYFPRLEGCLKQGAVALNVPWGNKSTNLTVGCGYFFDAQSAKGDWLRLSSDNESVNGKWVERTYVEFKLCKVDASQPVWLPACILK